MNINTKTVLFFLAFTLFSFVGFSQEKRGVTYQFVNSSSITNIDDYEIAFSSADMNRFRYADKSNFIEFESGLKVEIFSANKLNENGIDVDLSRILKSEPINKNYYTFALSTKKTIIQKFSAKKVK